MPGIMPGIMLMNIRFWIGIRQLLCSHFSVEQECPLSPLLFVICLKFIDSVADRVKGALTGTPNFLETHTLFADDLSHVSNDPKHMQTMLNRLSALEESFSLSIHTSLR